MISLRRPALRRGARDQDQSWLDEMAATRPAAPSSPAATSIWCWKHHNDASHLRSDVDAQWNDDGHNVLHVLLTGEDRGYYADYADHPAEKLARVLAEGWVFQGETSSVIRDAPRGTPSKDLPPTAFVLFLQNHDQIGNRAFGERLTVLTAPARWRRRSRCCCLSRKSRCCSWVRRMRPYALPVLHRPSGTGEAVRDRAAATNSPGLPISPTRRSASASPTRMHQQHSRPRCRSPIQSKGQRGRRCIAS